MYRRKLDTEDVRDFQFYPENDAGVLTEDKMLIAQGFARLGIGRSSAADFYIRGAMAAGGIEVNILAGASSLVACAVATLAAALTF